MSFDASAAPSIRLAHTSPGQDAEQTTGWGFAWYPSDELAAAVVKDPIPSGETPMTRVLRDWDRFRSTIFVCHIRGAAKRVTQEDTHPFCRSYAGRDWLLAHNGDLAPARLGELALGDNPVFEPVGRTDSELAFCWLLTRIREHGHRTLAAVGWERLRGWLAELARLGGANLLLSDGQDLVAFRDPRGFGSLHTMRRRPPHAATCLENAIVQLDLGDPMDASRTAVLFATTPLSDEHWEPLAPGQMLVARRGAVVWRSDAANEATPRVRGPRSASFPLEKRVLEISHSTVYRYAQPVERSSHVLRLQPLFDERQRVMDYALEIAPAETAWAFIDVFGNRAHQLEFVSPYSELRVTCRSRVMLLKAPSLGHGSSRTTMPLVWMPWQRQMMNPYLLPPELPESQLRELDRYAMSFAQRQDNDLVAILDDINETIAREFAYVTNSTNLETTPFDVYVSRRGVCQDFANLFVCLARLLGIPARYRVGYIFTGGDYANKVQSDASHAWVEVYLPHHGWRGYDPTNACVADMNHVRVACGRNFRDATPTSGTIYKGGGGETLWVDVRVTEVSPVG
ncbi:MAG: class II glutamine amidotransferase [Candidatus Wallbacteria bacterium]|nr:class II glutamine amidotransferase [Candidatus Wallbacteria bacterium]